jgi:tricorn protease
MSTRRLPAIVAFAVLVAGLAPGARDASGEPIKFARYPHTANGRLAFSYHGDIWIANADGSQPARLTAHIGRDAFPRFSPDGKMIAFTSNRMGNDDVFVVPASGGEPRQLTFNTVNDTVLYWTPDSRRVIFATQRGTRPWSSPIYSVSVDGGLPEPLAMDAATTGMMKQDGTLVAFNRMGGSYWRKGYRGNRADDIWIQDVRTRKISQLTDANLQEFRSHTTDVYPMWGADGMIYFSSERDGTFNIWKIAAAGASQPQQVTFHKEDGVQFPSISPDGKTIVYENEFDVWTLSVPGGTPTRVRLDLDFDPKENMTSYVSTANKVDAFSPSHEGDYLAVDFHGEVFVVPTDAEVGEKSQVTASGRRDQNGLISPDGRWVAYVSDESKESEIWVFDRTSGQRKKLSTHPSFKEIGAWSADSKLVAYTGANRLFVADVAAGTSSEVAYNEAGGYQNLSFAPDGKWLAYGRRDEEMNPDVHVLDLTAKREHNVTANPFNDSRGVITPDAKRLVFLSDRDGGIVHLFVVPLERQREDPDDPLVRERLKKAAPPARERGGDAPTDPSGPPPALRVEVDEIDRRATQLTRGEDAVTSYVLSADGKLVYFLSRDDKGPGLFSIGIDGKDRKRVADGQFTGLVASGDRKKVFFTQEGEIQQMELTGEKRKSKVAFNLTVKVDHRAEWQQIFDECWRVMKYRFYDEKMHGRDWVAIRARYEPLLKYVGENQDVYDLANEMIGELNASHTGVNGPPTREMPEAYKARHPGFELEPENGRYRISHIYRNGPADKEWLDLKVGDVVTAIDGTPIKAGDNYWRVLNHTLNDYVTVSVAGAGAAPERKVRIKTVPSLTDIKYEEWVAKNREFVDRESKNQVAYVHIRAMNQPSLRKFQNEINQFWNKKGIVVDIRYNGGGNIDQELLDILERRPYEYWNNRWGARTWGRRPRQAIAGPKVMLINHRSGSDSEVTPMGFRDLGLGRIVGNPTAGGVIATGSFRLINGGTIRTPGSLVVTYDPTKPNNYGINLENYGVAPDVWVENTPEDELNGFDRELKTAVDEALRMMKERKWQFTTEADAGVPKGGSR